MSENKKQEIKTLDVSVEPVNNSPKRKKRFPLKPLAPGHSTHYFSEANADFDVKGITEAMNTLWKAFHKKKWDASKREIKFFRVPEDVPSPKEKPGQAAAAISSPTTEEAFANEELATEKVAEELVEELASVTEEETETDAEAAPPTSAESRKTSEVSGALQNIFLNHIQSCLINLNIDDFIQMLIVNENFQPIYSNLSEKVDIEKVKESTLEFLGQVQSLIDVLHLEKGANYLWLEDEVSYIALANCPEKKFLPFLFTEDKPPLHFMFEHGEEMELPPAQCEKFFLLKEISAPAEVSAISSEQADEKQLREDLQALTRFILAQDSKIVAQDAETGEMVSQSMLLSPDKHYEMASHMLSLAGLCFNGCHTNFEVEYMLVETDSDTLLWAQDEQQQTFFMTICDFPFAQS